MKFTWVLARLSMVFVSLKLVQALIIIFVPSQFDVSSRLLLEKYTAQKTAMVTFHTASPRVNSILSSISKWLLKRYFEKLVTWDAVYFSDLFVNDLQYEHQFVFCPLWWRIVRMIPVNQDTAFYSRLIMATLLSNTFHWAAAVVLYYYTHVTFQDARIFSSRRMALAASVLFICSPAAAFMTAPYSESAASFFSFACLYMREVSTRAIAMRTMGQTKIGDEPRNNLDPKLRRDLRRDSNPEPNPKNPELNSQLNSDLNVQLSFKLRGFSRGEGVDSEMDPKKRALFYTHYALSSAQGSSGVYVVSGLFAALAFGLRANCLLLGLVYLYDLYGFQGIHKRLPLVAGSVLGIAFVAVQVHGYVRVCYGTGRGEWCDSRMPSLFAYAQTHYWNNGFLKYWTLGNAPNFVFAAPTMLFSALSVRYFAYMYPVARVVPVLVVNVVYLFLQCLFWHVQIITRVHTFLPIVYWFLAGLMTQGNEYGRRWAVVALTYFAIWNVSQVALFGAFLPPA